MNMSTESNAFNVRSYRAHEQMYQSKLASDEGRRIVDSWHRQDTVNAWILNRELASIDPFLSVHPTRSWLTVADGRFGSEGQYIRARAAPVMVTDIADNLLIEAKRMGLIDAYQKENAEHLSFADESFDYALCVQAYHHFPRPSLAVYEMLRVVREAMILIEPNDCRAPRSLKDETVFLARMLLTKLAFRAGLRGWTRGLPSEHDYPWADSYEPVGNYVYKVSERELQKVALGLDLPALAVRRFNIFYEKGVEFEKEEPGNDCFERIRRIIDETDAAARRGIIDWGVRAIVIFKRAPAAALTQALTAAGYRVVALPRNPYAKSGPPQP